MPPETSTPRLRLTARSAVQILLLLASAAFLALHALHLNADLPNYSPWMDWSKYTDEGWYGDGAIRHFLLGHWHVPGDFNPAAALPVWPFLEFLLFRYTGVSLAAARALTVTVFGLILISSYFLVRRWTTLANKPSAFHLDPETCVPTPTPSLAPAITVLLLSVSPFCYAFTRLAILEPLLILLTLLALLTTSYISAPEQGSTLKPHLVPGTSYLAPVLLGLLIPLMVLTKTTAIFLLPAIAWLLWVRAGYRVRPFIRISLIPAAVAAAVWLTYYLAFVRPYYLPDFHYLFAANAYTGITSATALSVLSETVADGLWIGNLIFPLSLLATLIAVLHPRIARRNSLVPALLFWAAGYTAFLAYHNNLQPRYYLVVAVPLTLLIPIVFESIWQARTQDAPVRQAHPLAATALIVALIITAASDARETLHFVTTPEYTFTTAAAQIRQIIDAYQREHPNHNPLVLSISGSNLSLMTGLRSICDDFGTMQLNTRIATYRPGWFVTWNQVDDDKMDALAPIYHLQRVAEFPVMDDPERNLLILYHLDPAPSTTPPAPRRRKPIPKPLQTKVGQQPSVIQLQH